MKKILVLFVLSLFVTFNYGQEVTSTEPIGGDKVASGTGAGIGGNKYYELELDAWGFFADRPGVDKPYIDSSNYYTTLCPTSAYNGIVISFQQFDLEKHDTLKIYDEKRHKAVTATTLPEEEDLVKVHTGRTSPGTIISKKGCLTFCFKSDDSVVGTGWYAKQTSTTLPIQDLCKEFNRLVDSNLECGVKIIDNTFRGKSKYDYYNDCTMTGWPSSGREIIYKYVNEYAGDLKFTLNEYNGDQPKVLNMFILTDCDPGSCDGEKQRSINRPAANGHQDRNYVSIKDAPAGVYYVVIDGNTRYAYNKFDLLVECTGYTKSEPMPNDWSKISNSAQSVTDINELKIAPNPTRGLTNITLNLEQEQNISLQVFSQTGQVVRSIQIGRTQFINEEVDLSDLANGLYLIRATGEQSVFTKKIVLHH